MINLTPEEISEMTLKDAMAEMSNRVYEAAVFMEQLEHAGKVYGNGHHAAQKIAEFAEKEVENRWISRTYDRTFEGTKGE